MLNVRANTVCHIARKFGVSSKFESISAEIPDDILYELYENASMSSSQISKLYNQPVGVILRKLRNADIKIRESGGKTRPSKHVALNDAAWLYEQYVVLKKSMSDIRDIVGTNVGNISHHLKKYGIPIRTKDEVYGRLRESGVNSTCLTVKTKWGLFHCDSKLEADYLRAIELSAGSVQRNVEPLMCGGLLYYPDFIVDGSYVEVKPKEGTLYPGVNRQRLTRQFLIAKKNNIDLKIWCDKGYYDYVLEDVDKYYCLNWKLIFNDAAECSKWLYEYGFHGVLYPINDLIHGIKNSIVCKQGYELNANVQNEFALRLIRHFSQHYYYSTHKGYNSVADAWSEGNYNILLNAIRKLWESKREINLYGLISVIHKHFKDYATVSIFKPWIARTIYNKYIPKGGTVIDPCMGWGGRLIGSIGLPINYIGYDINPLVIESHQKLTKFLGGHLLNAPQFSINDSSLVNFSKADLLFTSPPYDDTELYYGINSYGIISEPIYNNIFAKFDGIVVLNVPKRHSKLCVDIASKYNYKLIEELQMKTSSFMGREKTYEPILVFNR